MISTLERRLVARSAVAHALLILGFYLGSVMPGCRYRPRPIEPIMVFTFPDAPAPRDSEPSSAPPAPTPPEAPKTDIPEPAPKPPKPKVEVSKVKVTRPPPPPPPRPLSAEELRKLLAGGKPLPAADSRPGPANASVDLYLALVRKAMYDAWEQPGGLRSAMGRQVIASVRIARDGTVTRAEIIRPTGISILDESVEKALRAVNRLPPLPESYRGPHRDIQIAFELSEP